MNKLMLILFFCVSNFYSQSFSQNLKESIKELDPYIQKVLEDWDVPGLAVALVHGSDVVFQKGYGFRNIEDQLPADENTLFKIASVTKQFTSGSFGVLCDMGEATLDQEIIKLLPDFRMSDEYTTQHITVRDMLCHRTGLPRHGFIWYGTDLSRKEMAATLPYLDPVAGFREKHIYSNLMYDIVAHVIEEITNVTWEEFTKQHLLDPLGMNRTSFGPLTDSDSNVAYTYNFDKDENHFLPVSQQNIMYDYGNIPAGGINTSVNEISNWMIMCLNGGQFNGKPIISSQYLNEGQSVQIGFSKSDYSDKSIRLGYGLGWYVDLYHGHPKVYHGGGTAGYNSNLILFPTDSIGIVVLTSSNSPASFIISEALAQKALNLEFFDWNEFGLNNPRWNGSAESPEETSSSMEIAPPELALSDYAGSYYHKGYGEVLIEVEDNKLVGKRSAFQFNLVHKGENTFELDGGLTMYSGRTLQFFPDKKGVVNKISIDFESQLPPIEFLAKIKPGYKHMSDVIYGYNDGMGLLMDIYIPDYKPNGAAIVAISSGGMNSSPEMNHDAHWNPYMKILIEKGYTVFAVAHPSQPKYTLPDIKESLSRAIRHIKFYAGEYAIDPERIGTIGSSSGGHNALMVGLNSESGTKNEADSVDQVLADIQAVVALCPSTDLLNFGKADQTIVQHFKSIGYNLNAPFDFKEWNEDKQCFERIVEEDQIQEAYYKNSPINNVDGDDPPVLLIHGDADSLVPISQSEMLYEELQKKGVISKLIVRKGMGHGMWNLSKDELETIVSWFDTHLL